MAGPACFVCNKEVGVAALNIFTSQSTSSDTMLYKFLALFLGISSDELLKRHKGKLDSCCVCEYCYDRINQYDEGIVMAEKAQEELMALMNKEQSEPEGGNESGTYAEEDIIEHDLNESQSDPQLIKLEEVEEIEEEHVYEEIELESYEEAKELKPEIKRNKQKRKYEKKPKSGLVCSLCSVSFASDSELEEHRAAHANLLPLQCPTCHKVFTQKGALVRHMPMHTGQKPFFCSACGKAFIHHSSYHMHQLAHEDVREKSCETCGQKFRSNSHLARHQRIHSGQKPFACPICNQKFAQRYNMTSHLKVHQGIHRKGTKKVKHQPECGICAMVFDDEQSYDNHMDTVHTILGESAETTITEDAPIQESSWIVIENAASSS